MFTPTAFGAIELKNRIVMAPMTRSRAAADDSPTSLMAEYYAQRATAGLIITEGVQPSMTGKGYCRTPAIFSSAHVHGWSAVAAAVHRAGGKIVMQIMHAGRIASALNKDGAATVAPSAIQARGRIHTDVAGLVDYDMPRALTLAEIQGVVDEFGRGARNAFAAGMDGVELHCTGGYLAAQFLATGTNRRGDRYGGSAANRIRFVVETLEAMSAARGPERVGLKIGPGNPLNDLQDDAVDETFTALLAAISDMGLAYVHVVRIPSAPVDAIALVRKYFTGPRLLNQGYDFPEAAAAVGAGLGAVVAFGRSFLANPDLVERYRRNLPLAPFDPATLYTPGPAGYTDYPAYDVTASGVAQSG